MSDPATKLQGVLDRLLSNDSYNSIIREIAGELHDGFEVILCEAITNNPGEQVDGLSILAILMNWTRQIQATTETAARVRPMGGLPSQRYGNSSGASPDNDSH